MKFYSEVTKEMYDTVEALQAAEKKVNFEAEKEEDINEIFDIVKEAANLEQKTLKLMKDFDTKYGFGSCAKELLSKANDIKPTPVKTKPESADSFITALDMFLKK